MAPARRPSLGGSPWSGRCAPFLSPVSGPFSAASPSLPTIRPRREDGTSASCAQKPAERVSVEGHYLSSVPTYEGLLPGPPKLLCMPLRSLFTGPGRSERSEAGGDRAARPRGSVVALAIEAAAWTLIGPSGRLESQAEVGERCALAPGPGEGKLAGGVRVGGAAEGTVTGGRLG